MKKLTNERFAEIIRDKEICEFCEDCGNDEICINCEKVNPATVAELRLFWSELSALVKARDEGEMGMQFTAGDTVWVVECDEDGAPCDVSGYVFLTETVGYAIISPTINGSSDINDIFAYAVESTARDYHADFEVYPIADCYSTRAEAESALERGVQT